MATVVEPKIKPLGDRVLLAWVQEDEQVKPVIRKIMSSLYSAAFAVVASFTFLKVETHNTLSRLEKGRT